MFGGLFGNTNYKITIDLVGIKSNLATLLQEISMNTIDNSVQLAASARQENWLETVRSQVASLRFGVVQIVIHDSQVVQIERTEKVRLDRKPSDG